MTADARRIIEEDLARLKAARRRHFALALVLAVAASALAVVLHTRPDLLSQAPGRLVAQAVFFGLCLVAFPAVGVGLWFPGPGIRLGLVVATLAAGVVATTGWPLAGHGGPHPGAAGLDGCVLVVLGLGAALLLVGVLSGAFWQRRKTTSVFWIAAGLAFASLDVVTWMCPEEGLRHVLGGHVGPALALLAIAAVAGLVARRASPRKDAEGDAAPPGTSSPPLG